MRVDSAFNVRKMGYIEPSSMLALPSRYVGVEIEVENSPNSIPRQGRWNGWNIHRDNSLRNGGLEFVTPPSYGRELVELLDSFCTAAVGSGMVGTVRTGTHIHVNVTENDVESLKYIVGVYTIFEPALFRMVGEWRRWCNFCYSLEDAPGIITPLRTLFSTSQAQDLRTTATALELYRYSAINLAALSKYGTIEFRLFPTSFVRSELLLWINLVLCIVRGGEELYKTRVSPLKQLKMVGIYELARQVFGENQQAFSSIQGHIKDKDARSCRSILMSYDEVTTELLSAKTLEASGDISPSSNALQLEREFQTDPLAFLASGRAGSASTISAEDNVALRAYMEKHPMKNSPKKKKAPRAAAPTVPPLRAGALRPTLDRPTALNATWVVDGEPLVTGTSTRSSF